MRSIRRAALVGLILALSIGGLGCPTPSNSERPTGLVLITVDGLVPGDISVYGGPIPMPALDRMVRDGRAWRDVWTAAPMARPGAATYLTGLAADRHQVLDDLHDALPEGIPTLGSVLTEAGYRTAAFSESSAISSISGLNDGFRIVDPPPMKQEMLRRLTPRLKPIRETSDNFARWLDSVPNGTRYFAWVHLSRPFRAQTFQSSEQATEAMEAFNRDIERILDTVIKRGSEDSAVILAGTFGRVGSISGRDFGLGTSMAEPALQVPLIVRAQGVQSWRAADASVWGPDVAVTVARLAGVDLPGAEGVALQDAAPQRTIFSMSRAPLDQLGWRPIAAARFGSIRLARVGATVVEDLLAPDAEVPAARIAELEQALDRRPVPLGSRLSSEAMSSILEEAGVTPTPVDPGGRLFPAGDARDRAIAALWTSRRLNGFQEAPSAMMELKKVVAVDPQAAQPLVDLGLFDLFLLSDPEGRTKVRRAAALYPTHPEVARWLALAIWTENVTTGEKILNELRTVRPKDPDLLYDLACARTLAGDLEGAEQKLRAAIEAGFREFDLMNVDDDLRALRESGRLAGVLRDYR